MNTEAGRYTIDIKNLSGGAVAINNYEVDLGLRLPKQIMRLRGYRVAVHGDDSDDAIANAVAIGVVYVKITDSNGTSVFSKYHLIDNNVNTLYFSLALDEKAVTNRDSLNKVCYLSMTLPEKIYVSAYMKTGDDQPMTIASNVTQLYLDFETQTGTETNVRG